MERWLMRNRNWLCIGTMAAALCSANALAGSSSGCTGDYDGNYAVDAADLGILLGGWGTGAGDLDGNGTSDGGDLALLLGAWGDCPVVGPCGSGLDCCTAHFSLACNDVTCCQTVCDADIFCCSVAWDSNCAGAAVHLCPELCRGCGTGGNCCTASGGLGCNDVTCCEHVCAADASCCSVAWDGLCASEAASICADLCGTGSSNCCTAWGGTGCDVAICQSSVCARDSYCCSTEWDAICAGEAASLCPDLCGNPVDICGTGGDCCTASGGLGCNVLTCCENVCASDISCCSVAWDGLCATEAATICADLCSIDPFNCCKEWGGVGCDDPTCEALVCAVDNFCCSFAWDTACAAQAASLCPDLCEKVGGGGSTCCDGLGGFGCDDPICQASVCAVDPSCCTVGWDFVCASEAASLCPGLCG